MSVAEVSTDAPVVFAATAWPTNAHMIRDAVVPLGYLRREWRTCDATFGLGRFWTLWRPDDLVCHDIDKSKGDGVDFRSLPHDDDEFDATVLDGPYKLNGAPTAEVDGAYGVHVVASRDERHQLIMDGMTECARVTAPNGYLLVKCQDQVNGGKMRWQTDIFTRHGESLGLVKVDRFDILTTPRPQPARTRADGAESVQGHARRNYSTLLVFQKPKRSRRTAPTLL